jgi:chromosome segregation ATPase
MKKTGLLLLLLLVFILGYLANRPGTNQLQSTSTPETSNRSTESAVQSQSGQQAGIAQTSPKMSLPQPSPSVPAQSVEQKAKVNEQRQALAKLSHDISQIENTQNQRQSKLEDVRRQIQDQSNEVQRLIADRNNQKNEQYQSYVNQVQQAQSQEVSRATEAAQLQDQLAQSQYRLSVLNQQIQYMSAWKIESDALKEAKEKYQEEMKRYQGIQDSLVQARTQAGQAASLNQLKQDWQQKSEQQEYQSEYLPQLQRAQAKLQELQNEYQQLQKQDVDQRSQLGDMYQQFDEAQNNLSAMTARS